jgi:CheY-like chemotaxis protein
MPDPLVLIVDDNPETLNLLAHALASDHIAVKQATSVFKAIEALYDGSPRPSVIITDLMMPQTTGWDFLKHLRGEEALRHIPVIILTGADPGEADALADVVLHKPIDPLELVQTVRSLTGEAPGTL